MNHSPKRWFFTCILSAAFLLFCIAAIIVYVDPFFHYHLPLENRKYVMQDQRYINDGVAKHFRYDALITGSSMTENFKSSEMDALFGTHGVKLPFSGGSFKEVNSLVTTACRNNPDLKMVIRGLDFNRFLDKKDKVDYTSYPEYLYDDFLLNDAKYVFNMSVLMRAIQNFITPLQPGELTADFDEYSAWEGHTFSRATVEGKYFRHTLTLAESQPGLTEQERQDLQEHVQANIIDLAVEYPNVQFNLFVTPYSICYWDYFRMEGNLERQFEAEEYLIEALLPYENIHLYSFHLEHDVIENLDNYYDVAHHSPEINSQILVWIKEGTGLLTKENYKAYLEEEHTYYRNFDYDTYFADWPN